MDSPNSTYLTGYWDDTYSKNPSCFPLESNSSWQSQCYIRGNPQANTSENAKITSYLKNCCERQNHGILISVPKCGWQCLSSGPQKSPWYASWGDSMQEDWLHTCFYGEPLLSGDPLYYLKDNFVDCVNPQTYTKSTASSGSGRIYPSHGIAIGFVVFIALLMQSLFKR